MRFYRSFLLCCCLAVSVVAGCTQQETTGRPTVPALLSARADSAYRLLRNMRSNALGQAFERRIGTEYFRRSLTEQIDVETGNRIAFYEVFVRHAPDEDAGIQFEVLAADSAGDFELSFIDGLLDPSYRPGILANPAPHLMPEQPTYTSRRGPQLYTYELLPDTLLAGRPTVGVEITLKPGAGEDQRIHLARFYIDRRTDELVSITIHRRQEALLFEEESILQASIRLLPTGEWFPYHTSYQTIIQAPFLEPKQLHNKARYFVEMPAG